MKPLLAIPYHDPDGLMVRLIDDVTPTIKHHFARACISITPKTEAALPDLGMKLIEDPFFCVRYNAPDTLPGDHFRTAYAAAVAVGAPDQVVHLCDLDRVAFALAHFPDRFLHDIRATTAESCPLLFQRSAYAWSTHPTNYRTVESWLVQAGELLFGRYYDFAWSHMALTVSQLQQVLDEVESRDFSLLIEMVLLLREQLETKDVDWLAWEDPFLYQRSADALRRERDASLEETHKRLRGILPFFTHLLRHVEPLSPERTWDKPTAEPG